MFVFTNNCLSLSGNSLLDGLNLRSDKRVMIATKRCKTPLKVVRCPSRSYGFFYAYIELLRDCKKAIFIAFRVGMKITAANNNGNIALL
jgi:hypothetical protein